MALNLRYGLILDLPSGEDEAQIAEALDSVAPLFDRDKELLIWAENEQREAACSIVEQYGIDCEDIDLLQLPASVEVAPTFTDFGLISRTGKAYAYADCVCLFKIEAVGPGSEPAQAALQMDEHLLARYRQDGALCFVAEAQSDELMTGIAKAYRCEVQFILPDL